MRHKGRSFTNDINTLAVPAATVFDAVSGTRLGHSEGLIVSSNAKVSAEQLGCAFDQGPVGAYIQGGQDASDERTGSLGGRRRERDFGNATLASESGVTAGTVVHRSLAFPAHV